MHDRYEIDLDEDSLCVYVGYWLAGCQGCRPSRLLGVFIATWLRGLAMAAVATGSLGRALDCRTLWILVAGEVATFAAACCELCC